MKTLLRKLRLVAALVLLSVEVGILVGLGALLQLGVLQTDSPWSAAIAAAAMGGCLALSILAGRLCEPNPLPTLDTTEKIKRRHALPVQQDPRDPRPRNPAGPGFEPR